MAKGEETRTAIVKRATELTSIGGLSGVSIGDLAEAMGMSKSGVFAHFRSKESLDLAVIEHVRERYVDEVIKPAFRAKRGIARVERLAASMHAWIASESFPGGCPLIAAVFELDDKPGPARDLVVASQRDLLSTIAQTARVAVEEGEFRRDVDVDQLAFDVYGAMLAAHAAIHLLHDDRSAERFRRSVDRVIDAARP